MDFESNTIKGYGPNRDWGNRRELKMEESELKIEEKQ